MNTDLFALWQAEWSAYSFISLMTNSYRAVLAPTKKPDLDRKRFFQSKPGQLLNEVQLFARNGQYK